MSKTNSTTTTGVKIALPGYDARMAPDYCLSFSSNWPQLQIAKTFTHTVTAADVTAGAVVLRHELGFYAFADVWAYGATPNTELSRDSYYNFTGSGGTYKLNSLLGYQLFFGKQSIMIPLVTNKYWKSNTPIAAGTKLNVKVYSFDLTQPFEYSAINPPVSQSTYDPKVGIKIVRPGRDIKSKDLRNFIIHSKGSAPQLLTVQTPDNANIAYTTAKGSTTATVTYQIPVNISARLDFLFSTDGNAWGAGSGIATVTEADTNLPYYASVYGQYQTQSVGNVSFQMTSSGLFTSFGLVKGVPFSVIVRRDPLLYAEPKKVTI